VVYGHRKAITMTDWAVAAVALPVTLYLEARLW
jgi:hypothetical protein